MRLVNETEKTMSIIKSNANDKSIAINVERKIVLLPERKSSGLCTTAGVLPVIVPTLIMRAVTNGRAAVKSVPRKRAIPPAW